MPSAEKSPVSDSDAPMVIGVLELGLGLPLVLVLLEVLLLLELLLQAATSNAAETAATAVSPALLVDTEYNGVPRLFRSRHTQKGMCEIRSVWPDLC
jgi:hypothetical protein